MFNYHELTMNEPRDSPARRQQFRVICTIMVVMTVYGTANAGLFTSLVITEGTFPGGEFVYKSAKRDYAAAPSVERQVAEDLNIKPQDASDVIYTIYLDHPAKVNGGRNQRFASGLLVNSKLEKAQEWKTKLLQLNDHIVPPTRTEALDLPATALWKRIRYKSAILPEARVAMAYFTFTNGFVSSLIHTYIIIPKLRAHAAQKLSTAEAAKITIITTCSIPDGMCTHYAPLDPVEPFLLGQPGMDEYIETLPKKGPIDFELVRRRISRGMQQWGKFFGGKSQGEVKTATIVTGQDEATTTDAIETESSSTAAEESTSDESTKTSSDEL
jgi:hypothetical protein